MGGNKWGGGTEEVDQDDQVIRSQGCQLALVVVMCEDLLKMINQDNGHTCKKREIPEIYLRNFFWILG